MNFGDKGVFVRMTFQPNTLTFWAFCDKRFSFFTGILLGVRSCRNTHLLNAQNNKITHAHLIPFDTRGNAKVDVYVLLVFYAVANRQKSVQSFFQEPP